MKTTYTPGPWISKINATGISIKGGEACCKSCGSNKPALIATLPYSSIEVQKANARLIAAAPDMYEALKQVDFYFQSCAKVWTSNEGRVFNTEGKTVVQANDLDELCNEAAISVVKAIAKAEGGA